MDPAPPSPRLTAALDRLRAQGERVTPARRAVLQVIDDADRADEHLTAEQIGARVGSLEPTVHRATVYRTLTSLTDVGVLSHVHLGGTATVYHLVGPEPGREATVDAGAGTAAYGHGHPHAHVQCVACGKVLDVPPEALDGVAERLLDELGFALDTAHAALLGRCADCS